MSHNSLHFTELCLFFVLPLRSSGDINGSLLRRLSVRLSVCPSVTKLIRTTPHKLLVQFHPNFTGMISTKSNCAYCQHFPFNDFCQSYGPLIIFNFKVCPDYSSYTTYAISMKLYRIDL
jgi:hypothetical protein